MTQASLIKWVGRLTGVKTVHSVPKDTPKEFITIERLGGAADVAVDRASFAIQCWAETSAKAARMAHDLQKAFLYMQPPTYTDIYQIKVESLYEFPDLKSRKPRYQMVVHVIAKI